MAGSPSFAEAPAAQAELADLLLRSNLANAERVNLAQPDLGGYEFAARAGAMFAGVSAGADQTSQQVERELCDITLEMLGLPANGRCILTSSGSESILLGLRAARDADPQRRSAILAPGTVHPAVDKAARIIGVQIRKFETTDGQAASVEDYRAGLHAGVFATVASAPAWATGVWDDLPGVSSLCEERGIHLHVDACIGGLLAPFMDDPPYAMPLPSGSISLDWHKFGYAPMHLSALCFSDVRAAAAAAFPSDVDGLPAASDGLASDRPFAPIAAAWATARLLGRKGYQRLARVVMDRKAEIAHCAAAAGFEITTVAASPIVCLHGTAAALDSLNVRLEERRFRRQRLRRLLAVRLRVDPLLDRASFDSLLDCIGAP